MYNLLSIREQYGNVYVTLLPDDLVIPWKPLSIEDFFVFTKILQSKKYPFSFIEDEIFKKCVVDPVLVNHIHQLKAGTVTTVATAILSVSGPTSAQEIEISLQLNRAEINSRGVFYDLLILVTQAFPTCTIEYLNNLSFDKFMQHVALAERKLLSSGMLQEPITFSAETPVESPKPIPTELKQVFEKQHKIKPVHKTPVSQQTIITDNDILEQVAAFTGMEKADKVIYDKKMIEETAGIYDDYLKQQASGEKLKIKSVEERTTEAIQRLEQSKQQYQKQLVEQKQQLNLIEQATKRKLDKAAKKKRRG